MELLPIKELINSLERELIRVGYAEATLNYYRENWKRIEAHFNERGEIFFSEAIAMEYVDSKCGFFEKERAGKLTQSNVYLFRIIRMLGDFQQHGAVLRRYHRSLSKINAPINQVLLERFKIHCRDSGYAISTQKSYTRTAENFLSYIESKSISAETVTAQDLTDFVKTLLGYSYKMVEFVLCGTRAFLRFLYNEKSVATDLSTAIPNIQSRKQTRIPSVWNRDDLEKLLASIDRGNPSGKRDYALDLFRNLKIAQFKITNTRNQSKTKPKPPSPIAITFSDYPEAFNKSNSIFVSNAFA